ncbi:MAG TPA: hypothetical protein VFH67_04030, partial [bacterium]|nr:hypothetical protein [bacterium]
YVRRLLDHAALSDRVARERGWLGRLTGTALVLKSNLSLLLLDLGLIVHSVWLALLGEWEV